MKRLEHVWRPLLEPMDKSELEPAAAWQEQSGLLHRQVHEKPGKAAESSHAEFGNAKTRLACATLNWSPCACVCSDTVSNGVYVLFSPQHPPHSGHRTDGAHYRSSSSVFPLILFVLRVAPGLVYCTLFNPCSEDRSHFLLGFSVALITVLAECFTNSDEPTSMNLFSQHPGRGRNIRIPVLQRGN